MSGFDTKEKNNYGEYETTFYTESRQEFKKVQDFCRTIIGHGKPTPEGDLISRSALKKAIEQGEGFSWDSLGKDDLCVRKKYIDNAPTAKDEIKWHNLKENPNDKPTKVGWYCCKISSSNDLKMVFGQSEVMSGRYDAWLFVSCPY